MPSVSGFAFRLRFSSLCCGLFPLEQVDRLAGSASDGLGDATFLNLCRLCSSGLVGAAGAAPPCAAFSRARLRPGGPPPVRALPTGIPAPTASQRRELEVSATQSSSLALPGGVPWGENPSSSLLWMDPVVVKWLRLPHSFPVHKSWVFSSGKLE